MSGSGTTENDRPNIILLVADDMGWNDVSYHGSGINTPNIDKLGESGAELNQFYVMPSCTPARASMMTGRYTMRYGLQVSVIKNSHKHGLPVDEKIIPQALKEVGYQTAIIGKWHLGHAKPEYLPTNRGFDYQYGGYTGMIDYVKHTSNEELTWDAQLLEVDNMPIPTDELVGNDWNHNGEVAYEKGYATDLIRDEAVRVIEERDKSKPLFLYVPFTAPHTPLQAVDLDLEQYKDADLAVPKIFDKDVEMREQRLKRRRFYAALVSNLDSAIGKIMETIEEQGMSKDTLVVFLSDNGASYQGGNNDPLRGQKALLYEGGVRVPALLAFPGRIEPGTFIDEPLHAVDLYPTLLNIAGASLEQEHPVDGKDMWATVTRGEASPHEDILINAREGRSSAIRMGDWKLVRNGHLGPIKVLGDGEPRNELFNLKADPYEKNNLLDENPEMFEKLSARLDAYTAEAVPHLWTDSKGEKVGTPKVWGPYWWEK